MSLLAVQYPWQYQDIFEPLIDFEVLDVWRISNPKDVPGFHKPVWLDCTGGVPLAWRPLVNTHDGVILPIMEDADMNIFCASKSDFTCARMVVWVGEKRHLKMLSKTNDVVAIPWQRPRSVYIQPEDSHQYHYYGFCNLDELRRFPVRSLSTSVPITSALVGIDLRDRERRPKNLPAFSYDIKLSPSQIDLAVHNIQLIREAMTSHERK